MGIRIHIPKFTYGEPIGLPPNKKRLIGKEIDFFWFRSIFGAKLPFGRAFYFVIIVLTTYNRPSLEYGEEFRLTVIDKNNRKPKGGNAILLWPGNDTGKVHKSRCVLVPNLAGILQAEHLQTNNYNNASCFKYRRAKNY